jgi:hypothetical protein
MAVVVIGKKEFRIAHYGLYRTKAGGDESVIVRRQIPQPSDFIHPSNRALSQQRDRLGVASRHYSNLTPTQKRHYRNLIGFVDVTGSPSETKVLKGRQLFIAREIQELATRGLQLVMPYEVCIILCDVYHNELRGTLHVYYYEDGDWHECNGGEIYLGHWLYTDVPRDKEWYRVEGEAQWYYDPKLPETEFMTAQALLAHHYHVLLEGGLLLLLETWETVPDIEWQQLLLEEWLTPEYTIEWQSLLLEEWLSPDIVKIWQLKLTETWGGPLPEEGYALRHYEQWKKKT